MGARHSQDIDEDLSPHARLMAVAEVLASVIRRRDRRPGIPLSGLEVHGECRPYPIADQPVRRTEKA